LNDDDEKDVLAEGYDKERESLLLEEKRECKKKMNKWKSGRPNRQPGKRRLLVAPQAACKQEKRRHKMFVMQFFRGKASCLCQSLNRAQWGLEDEAPEILGMQWSSKEAIRKNKSLSIC
jgi:hypothetical protein